MTGAKKSETRRVCWQCGKTYYITRWKYEARPADLRPAYTDEYFHAGSCAIDFATTLAKQLKRDGKLTLTLKADK